jgi:hypothetical protein
VGIRVDGDRYGGVPEQFLAAAIRRVAADSFGMDKGEIPTAVLRLLLGFKRTTEGDQRLVIEVLDSMVTENINRGGNHVSLKG